MVPAPVQLHVYTNTYDTCEGTCIRLAQHTQICIQVLKKSLLFQREESHPSNWNNGFGWLTGQWANQAGRLWFRGQGQGCSWVWYSVSPDEIWVRRLLEPQSFLVIWPERIWGAERRGKKRAVEDKRKEEVNSGEKRWLMSACEIICAGFTLRLNQKVHFKWGNSKKDEIRKW